MPYIYKITNLVNNKVYIGKTSLPSVERRFQEHKRDYNRSFRGIEKRPLYEAMKKYGIENFFIEEIEWVATEDEACQKEKFWIKEYNSYIGFPNSNGYNATLGGDGKRLYNYQEIADKYLELGQVNLVSDYFHCDGLTVKVACEENGIQIELNPNKKGIQRIDKEGKIKEYNSVTEASYDIPNKEPETARKNISRAINRGKTAYGFQWKVL